MRTMKKVLCLLLLLFMLLPMVFACSNQGEDEETSEDVVSTEESTTNDNGGAPIPYMDDFQGYEYKVMERGAGAFALEKVAGDAVGNRVEIAVYKRNAKLEEKYNFKVKTTRDNNWDTTISNLGGAGQYAYDTYVVRANNLASYGQAGYVYNLYDIESLDLSAPYFSQSVIKEASFSGWLFFVTGDMMYEDDYAICPLVFNHKIWDTNKLNEVYGKDMYELVRSNEWTLEKFQILASKALADLNGDGDYDAANDQLGFLHGNADILGMNIGFNERVLVKNSDDVFILNRSDKFVDGLFEIVKIMNSPYSSIERTNDAKDPFWQNRALFEATWMKETLGLCQTNVDYGIVPFPKYDENQDEYYTMLQSYFSGCISIPTTVVEVDKIASIIELISYESMNSVTPELNTYLFEGRGIQHAEDLEMLDLIRRNVRFELCYLWSTGGMYGKLMTLVSSEDGSTTGIASLLEASESEVNASVLRKLDRLKLLG